MQNLFKLSLVLLILVFATEKLSAQKLKTFNSSITKKMGPKKIAVPYTDITSYMGYASPGTEDEIKDGKKFYYIYVWIPVVAPEIGVRMMSPAGTIKSKKIVTSADYTENSDSNDYFDTYITLERSDIFTKQGISEEGVANANWNTLARNDDSGEMPKNPGGRSYNSLLRYESNLNDPLGALTVGLYRIGFTTYKKGEVSGTFLAQVGSPVKLPGVGVAKTISALLEQINN
ncbi:Lipl32 family lipoprotein [bacterium]|jgi:hypothetical protein|nr:Lipl32 family lipoprotein [bacterium]